MTKEEEQKKYSNFFTALYRAVEQEATEKKREKKRLAKEASKRYHYGKEIINAKQ